MPGIILDIQQVDRLTGKANNGKGSVTVRYVHEPSQGSKTHSVPGSLVDKMIRYADQEVLTLCYNMVQHNIEHEVDKYASAILAAQQEAAAKKIQAHVKGKNARKLLQEL